MRICLVHSFYRSSSPSGENEVVLAQVRLLRQAGHEVRLVSARSDDEITGLRRTAATALAVARRRGHDPRTQIAEFRPDVIHIHNLFPNFGYQWIQVVAQQFPVVATLHNYRPICAKGSLYRGGASCEECLGGAMPALRHRCYRDSALATLPLVLSQRGGLSANPLFAHARRLITLTQRSAGIYQRAGVSGDRIVVIPNGIEPVPAASVPSERWLYAGRLTEEKGILEILASWPSSFPLDIVGDGPLLAEVQARAAAGVRVLGPRSRHELRQMMSQYRGLLLPSRWAEGLPLVLGEALSVGTPALVLEGSGAADFVAEFGGGLVYREGDDLGNLLANWAELTDRESARVVYDENLSAHTWTQRLLALYREVGVPD